MRVIEKVIKFMDNTLDEVETYFETYLDYKDDFPKMAKKSLDMAKTHLDLYNQWHTIVVDLINDYKITHGEIPQNMKEVWNEEHKALTKEYNLLRMSIANEG